MNQKDTVSTQDNELTRALLIALDTGEYDVEDSLDELEELAKSAGAEVVGSIAQKRNAPDPATCIGTGRLQEAKLFVQNQRVDLVIFDRELSGSQVVNIEKVLECRTIDRTTLILDIFAQRAISAEGRLQVELAQLKYRLPRLTGHGTELSRLGGGIGTRGPGETKLESDRRHIRRRLAALESQLEEVAKRRDLTRTHRRKNELATIAIVGYTNVGKSSLLNKLCNSDVLAEDMLFATLDPSARAFTLPNGRMVIAIDTVGLVRRLPHDLVNAFRSTLEEAVCASLILNVCDISDENADDQVKVTTQLLHDIEADTVPTILVLNKCDKISSLPIAFGPDTCLISAKTGFGLDTLIARIEEKLPATHTRLTLLFPYSEGTLTAEVRRRGTVFSERYNHEGIVLDVMLDNRLLNRCASYIKA